MCMVRKIIGFIENGVMVFREASHGEYRHESDVVSQLKEELFSTDRGRFDDRLILKQDAKAIEKDVHSAWNKVKLIHG